MKKKINEENITRCTYTGPAKYMSLNHDHFIRFGHTGAAIILKKLNGGKSICFFPDDRSLPGGPAFFRVDNPDYFFISDR